MSFIETYERQLVEAAERRYGRRSRRFVIRHRRGLAAAFAALAIGAPATAAVTGFDPFDGPGRSENIGRPTQSGSPVDPALTRQLGVLRRDGTAADRGALTSRRLRGVGQAYRGAQLDGIRVLDQERGVVLAPFEQMPVPRDAQGRPLPPFRGPEYRNVVCVVEPTADGFEAAACHNADKIERGLAVGSGSGEVSGLVPDGVARVRLIRGGRQTDAVVGNNYFHTQAPPPAVVEWIAADGSLVKRIELNAERSR